MRVVLISTYELGRQPFGLASPAAWLRRAGHEVTCADLSVSRMPWIRAQEAELIAFFLPMHTATRLAAAAIERIRNLNARAHLCCYGLYAPLNESFLRSLGVQSIIGGEFESALTELASRLDSSNGAVSATVLDRLEFVRPDRSGLPPLSAYAHLHANGRVYAAGYTEASRGCKHLCRHCPVVPVYGGKFRIVQPEVVLEDVCQQVEAGAEHITFGDPDFLNGPAHALRIVEALHREFPSLTYDATIKIEHLLKHRELLPGLRETGCILVTSAVESVEDAVLEKLDKRHTRADFIEVVALTRAAGIALNTTFVPFTPWTTREGYRDLLRLILELGLVDSVAPVQLGLRLLIPDGSPLLKLPEIREMAGPFDREGLVYPWRHRDPSLDELSSRILRIAARKDRPRREAFRDIWRIAMAEPLPENFDLMPRATIPYLDEPWYC